MTDRDCTQLMAMIRANYPAYHAKTDKNTQKAAIKIMSCILEDLEPKDCEMALMHYMSEPHEFPPNAGQIRHIAIQFRANWCFLKNMTPKVKAYRKQMAPPDTGPVNLLTDGEVEF